MPGSITILEPANGSTKDLTNYHNGYPATGLFTLVSAVRGFLAQGTTSYEGIQTYCNNGVWTIDFPSIPASGAYTLLVISTATGGPTSSVSVTFSNVLPFATATTASAPENIAVTTPGESDTLTIKDGKLVNPVEGTYVPDNVARIQVFLTHDGQEPAEGKVKLDPDAATWTANFKKLEEGDEFLLFAIAELKDGTSEQVPVGDLSLEEA